MSNHRDSFFDGRMLEDLVIELAGGARERRRRGEGTWAGVIEGLCYVALSLDYLRRRLPHRDDWPQTRNVDTDASSEFS